MKECGRVKWPERVVLGALVVMWARVVRATVVAGL
jgi:hypothetical protein